MKKFLLLVSMLLLFVCNAQAQSKTTGVVNLLPGMTAKLDLNNTTSTATLTFTGPSDRWYALQFGSFASGGGMQAGMDLVYFNGTTLVDAVHNGLGVTPSADAVNNWTVTSNTITGSTRTVIATRPFVTGDANDFPFVYTDASIDFAFSRRNTAGFVLEYHGPNRGYSLNNAFGCMAPDAPVAGAQSFCAAATVSNLTATGAVGADFNWYANPVGGTELTGGTALTTGNYYVSQTVDGCESTRTTVAVTVTVLNPPTAPAQSFCPGAAISDLTATGAVGATFKWYLASTGGMPLTNTTELETGDYFVSQSLGSCESTRTMVAVTVTNPLPPTVMPQSFCSGATVEDLVATGAPGATFTWYSSPIGGEPYDDDSVLLSSNYYVSQTVNGCESARAMAAVTVTFVNPPTAEPGQDFCSAEGIVDDLAATGEAGATFKWYLTETGGTALGSTTPLTTDTYWVSQTVGLCESARTPLDVTVTVLDPPLAFGQTFCGMDEVSDSIVDDLVATGEEGAVIKWYATPDSPTPLSNATPLTTTFYYASQTLNGCESDRTKILVTIQITGTPEGEAVQQFTAGETVASLDITTLDGAIITWYILDDEGEYIVIDPSTPLVDGMTYHVTQFWDECESNYLEITAEQVLSAASFGQEVLMVYPNPVQDVLTVSYKDALSEVAVLNLLGQEVLRMKVNGSTAAVDVSRLPGGYYIVKVTAAGGELSTLKIMKR